MTFVIDRLECTIRTYTNAIISSVSFISPKDNEDPSMIGFGNFLVSKGNLQNLDYVENDNKCGISFISSAVNITTVGALSTHLRAYYAFLKEGDFVNFFNFAARNLVYSKDPNDPIQVNDQIDLVKTYKNLNLF